MICLGKPNRRLDESMLKESRIAYGYNQTVYSGAIDLIKRSTMMTSYYRVVQSKHFREVSSSQTPDHLRYLDHLKQLDDEIEKQKTKNPPVEISEKHSIPTGPHLTKTLGVFNGPSGKETYYNLNMSGVVRILQRSGIDGYYWVRSDGVKMWGKHVMCAADLNIRPRGSLVLTSLGTGIVVDTGTFIYSNRCQLDIATSW